MKIHPCVVLNIRVVLHPKSYFLVVFKYHLILSLFSLPIFFVDRLEFYNLDKGC